MDSIVITILRSLSPYTWCPFEKWPKPPCARPKPSLTLFYNLSGGPGKQGNVISLFNKSGNRFGNCLVRVKWQNGSEGIYRAGSGGFVDLKCIEVGRGYFVFMDHLPLLCKYYDVCALRA